MNWICSQTCLSLESVADKLTIHNFHGKIPRTCHMKYSNICIIYSRPRLAVYFCALITLNFFNQLFVWLVITTQIIHYKYLTPVSSNLRKRQCRGGWYLSVSGAWGRFWLIVSQTGWRDITSSLLNNIFESFFL